MPKQLTLDEMMTVLFDVNPALYQARAAQIVELGQSIGQDIATNLNIQAGYTNYDEGVGLIIAFNPLTPDQFLPAALLPFDKEGSWP